MSRPLQLTVLAILAVLSAVAFLYWLLLQPTVSSEPFDATRWRELEAVGHTSNDPGCYRGAMALGAIENHILIGKTTGEVEASLGQPEHKLQTHWFYPVGQCSFDWVHSVLAQIFHAATQIEVGGIT